jgi:AcrR family transcriptional regulator
VGHREATRALLRETVVEALRGLLAERPWADVTMTQVARAAGVSRQTLYNEFGSREDLATTYAQWAAAEFLDEVEEVVAAHADDLEEALLAAFELFLDVAHDHPLVRAVEATSGAEGMAAFVSAEAGAAVVHAARARLAEILLRTWPDLPADEVPTVAEVLVRLSISHLTVPTGTPAEAAAQVGRILAPYLEHHRSST